MFFFIPPWNIKNSVQLHLYKFQKILLQFVLQWIFLWPKHWVLKYNFKLQPHKIVKHTQTIRRLLPTNCLRVFNHIEVLVLKGISIPCLACDWSESDNLESEGSQQEVTPVKASEPETKLLVIIQTAKWIWKIS